MRIRFVLLAFIALLIFSGCSTLKGWFTPQGQKLAQAKVWADKGRPLPASSLAAEALALEPGYTEARELFDRFFSAGQQEFDSETHLWNNSTDPEKWDRLHELYRWQQVLYRGGPSLGIEVVSVAAELQEAARGASLYHLSRGQSLLAEVPGPRQARKALAEGRIAADFDSLSPGLSDWLPVAEQAATQKLLVVPFSGGEFWSLGLLSAPLSNRIIQKLIDAPLPELTMVIKNDGLALTQSVAHNMVLQGQLIRYSYQEPKKSVRTENRERKVVVVDATHPEGVERLFQASVTFLTLTASASVAATFWVVEVPTGNTLISTSRDARVNDQIVVVSFTGDPEALTNEDRQAMLLRPTLLQPVSLGDLALNSLATAVAEDVRVALR